MPGPSPKQPSKRRRANTPKSYGAAIPIAAPAATGHDPELGFDAHVLVVRLWAALQSSAESRFYSTADWERVRFELWHANELLTSGKPIGANSWNAVQHGLSALLVSPAEKRRCGIELKPPGVDVDEVGAIAMMGTYRSKLQSVASPSR